MAVDLLAIISAAGTGAVTGYLTNNLALKMIFKEYGPLGGVVIKTKAEFIENISALVERDLINHQSLESEFSRPEFKKSYGESIDDFVNLYLEKRSGDISLEEVKGWDQNYQLLSSLAAAGLNEILVKESSALKEEKLNTILKKSKLTKALEKIYLKLIKDAEAKNFIQKIAMAFYKQLENQQLNQLLNTEIKAELNSFFKEALLFFRDNYQSLNSKNKAQFKEKLKDLFNLQSLSKNLLEEIKKIRLADFLKDEEFLKTLKKESKFKNLIKELLLNLKIEIDNSNLILDDLLNQEMKRKFKKQLQKFLSQSEAKVLKFVDQEEEELNKIIFKAVEAEIDNSSGFKAMSRQGIYSKYKEKSSEYGLPVSHLKNFLNLKLKEDNQKTAAQIMAKIEQLELSLLLDGFEVEKALVEIENSIWKFYQQNKEKRLFELISKDTFNQSEIENQLINFLFKSFKKISSDPESIDQIFNYTLAFKLSDFFSKSNLSLLLAKESPKIYDLLAENKKLISKTAEYLNEHCFELLNNTINSDNQKINTALKNYLTKLEADFSQKKLQDFYSPLKKKENVLKLTDLSLDFFYNNLPELLEGKVAEAAAANLDQLSDQEVQSAIEEFMGKELKPITYLGALLGAAAGIVFAVSGAESFLAGSLPLWLNYFSSAVLYGGVGWLTNVLAIWMIFNPYQKKEIANFSIPFTPGVVAKNRKRFAKSMGKFVEQELLKADSAAQLIENNREEIKREVLNYFENEEYQPIFKLVQKNKDYLAELIVDKLFKTIKDLESVNLKDLNSLLNKILTDLLLAEIEKTDFKTLIKNKLKTMEAAEEINDLTAGLEANLLSAVSVETISSAVAGKYKLDFSSQQLKKLSQESELYSFFKYLMPVFFSGDLDYGLKAKIINNIDKKSDQYLEKGIDLIYKQQNKIAKLINFKKDEIIEKEKAKQDGLLKNTLISGALYMADLDEFIDSVVKRVFKELKNNYFIEKEEELKNLFSSILDELKNSSLFSTKKLSAAEILNHFLSSKAGGNLITEVLYLSENKLINLMELILDDSKQQLISLEFEINQEEIDYFLQKQLNLEQKLQLLLKIKNIFGAKNLRSELLMLIEKTELKFLQPELKELLAASKLIEDDLFTKKELSKLADKLILLLQKEEYKKPFLKVTAAQIEKAAAELKLNLNRESLNYLLDLFLESAIDSFKENSENLLESLNLKELTAKEVEKMNPAEIEAIFDDFAGHYFAHLKQYGWFGGVFGLLQLLIRNLI